MIIENFHEFGGRQPEVAPLRKVLNFLGVSAPHSGQSFSDELLFGIGGGIGFSYFLFDQAGSHPIHLGTRIHTKETERPEFLQTICARIGVSPHLQNSSSTNAAAANMQRNLEQGRPPIVWVDTGRLPYLGLNMSLNSHHAVVVYGEEEDRVLLSEICPGPVTIKREQFRAARETSWSPKYRVVLIQKSDATVNIADAVRQGIYDCVDQMNNGLGITNFGLRGLEKWATVLTSSREKKSWMKIFPPGAALFDALFSIFCQIRLRGSGGSAYRGLYADFLLEASGILEIPALHEVAEAFRQSERMWTDLADAYLPGTVPAFSEIREMAPERKALFESRGADAQGEIEAIKIRMDLIAAEMRQTFPLGPSETKTLLNDLRVRILRVRDHEGQAIQMLEAAVGQRPPSRQEPQPIEAEVVEQVPELTGSPAY